MKKFIGNEEKSFIETKKIKKGKKAIEGALSRINRPNPSHSNGHKEGDQDGWEDRGTWGNQD